MGCKLKKELGAAAQCKIYGHRHVLKVDKAVDAENKELPEMKGWILHYLENDNSEKLITGNHNIYLKVKGKVYIPARTLEVAEIE